MIRKRVISFSIVLFACVIAIAHASTSSGDVSALNAMFTSLNSPSQLSGWKSSGGDPCGDSWKGIDCSGSAVTEIKLSGLKLSGSLGYQLSSLKSVTYFDVSKNNLKNDIPYQLPPNLEYLDLSQNSFTNNVPYSISLMSDLKYINLGHNKLNGDLAEIFRNLSKLTEMDVSFNKMTGNLPQSLGDLKSLTTLHLQNNQFTGSINILAKLRNLDDLNVENNKFTGWIPNELKGIIKLKTGGNSWSTGRAPPPPPGMQGHQEEGKDSGNKSALSVILISGIVLGVLALIAVVIALVARGSSDSSHFDDDSIDDQRDTSPKSGELSGDFHYFTGKEYKSFKDRKPMDSSISIDQKNLQNSPPNGIRASISDRLQSFSDNEFARRLNESRSNSLHAASYSLSDLLTATGNFATGRLLGEGTIGRVYRAKYPSGKVLAVKKIKSSLFQGMRPEEFSEIVMTIAKLKHPNIAQLYGYCSEQGQNMIIYEYFRNGSLHDFLHLSDDFSKPLTWNTRVRIALGVARAIEYLHEGCSPSIVHKNIKSSNIMLDMEFSPRLSDCGLATFHKTNENLGVGYPECTKPSEHTLKSDIYSFGVVMLELLTGRMPFDGSKPRSEQSLVRWATPQLHDIEALENMADPGLRGLYPPKSVSGFADIIALCIQEEPKSRPSISELVQALIRLVQQSSMSQGETPGSSCWTDDLDY